MTEPKEFPTFDLFLAAVLAAGGSTDVQTSASGRYPQGGPSSLKPDVVINARVGTGYQIYNSPPRDWTTEELRQADIDALASKGGAIFNDASTLQRLHAKVAVAGVLFNPARIATVTGRKFVVVNGMSGQALVTKVVLRIVVDPARNVIPAGSVEMKDCDVYLSEASDLFPDKVLFVVGLLSAWLSQNTETTFDSIDHACVRCYRWTGSQFRIALSDEVMA